MSERYQSDYLEVLAYVDGLLDSDPIRKTDFERRMAFAPSDAMRVRAYEAQNRALRHAGEDRLNDPIPERLIHALDQQPNAVSANLTRVAAFAVTIGVTISIGWILGQHSVQPAWSPRTSIEKAYKNALSAKAPPAPDMKHETIGQMSAVREPSDKLSMNIRAPDLTKHGYSIVDTQTLGDSNGDVAQLTYRTESGDEFSLFVRARWKESGTSMELENDGDVSVAFWLDGPLASAIVSRLPPSKTRDIAELVRKELRTQNIKGPLQSVETVPSDLIPGNAITNTNEGLPTAPKPIDDQTNIGNAVNNQL